MSIHYSLIYRFHIVTDLPNEYVYLLVFRCLLSGIYLGYIAEISKNLHTHLRISTGLNYLSYK